jgi:aminoglycoside phosphotransferase (APT) family kinase protein
LISSGSDITEVGRLLKSIFPRRRVDHVAPLSGGFINTNLKITFSSGEPPVVFRLYRREADLRLKEVEVLRCVRQTVPVPEVLYVEPNGFDGSGPFSILEFVEGCTFQQLKRSNNVKGIHQAATSVGETLAAIGRYRFDKPGRLVMTDNHELSVGGPYIDGPDPIPRILDTFLEDAYLQRRIGPLAQRLHKFIWAWAPLLPDLTNDSYLVHCDFGNRNILVNEFRGKWAVAAVLDWEFALSGSPLIDVGHFLRYERVDAPLREPYFSRAFVENGGRLPDRWRDVSEVIDLTALVELLTHQYLPDDITSEILELIHSTLDQRRPE